MCVEYELLKISNQLKFTPVPVIYTNDRGYTKDKGGRLVFQFHCETSP